MKNHMSPQKTAIKNTMIRYLLVACACIIFSINAQAQSSQSILVVVNDEPISAFDVQQRMKLAMVSNKEVRVRLKAMSKDPRTQQRFKAYMQSVRPTSREEAQLAVAQFRKQLQQEVIKSVGRKMQKKVLEELIDEVLILQEGKKRNAVITADAVTKRLELIAGQRKNPRTGRPVTMKEFLANLKKAGGISEKTFRQRIKSGMTIQRLVVVKYGRQLSARFGEADVDDILANTSGISENTQFNVQRVKLTIKNASDQQALAKRLVDAERLRGKFKSCSKTQELVNSIGGGVVQALGNRTAKQLPKEARAIFQEVKSGEMTPPNITDDGIELYAICSKRNIKGDDKTRAQIKNKLRQREFQVLRRRYLKDLRQDAYIEYRT